MNRQMLLNSSCSSVPTFVISVYARKANKLHNCITKYLLKLINTSYKHIKWYLKSHFQTITQSFLCRFFINLSPQLFINGETNGAKKKWKLHHRLQYRQTCCLIVCLEKGCPNNWPGMWAKNRRSEYNRLRSAIDLADVIGDRVVYNIHACDA